MDFDKMYLDFENRFNPYPVQMSRAEAFRCALNNRLITKSEYQQAREYFGELWFYVGD